MIKSNAMRTSLSLFKHRLTFYKLNPSPSISIRSFSAVSLNFQNYTQNDVQQSINRLKEKIHKEEFPSFKGIVDTFDNVFQNFPQFEFKKEDKINSLFECYSSLFKKLDLQSFTEIIEKESSQKILKQLLKPKYFHYFSNDSCVTILLILNKLKSLSSSRPYAFEEIKFLINYGISDEHKILKFFKYGKFIFKNKSRTSDKILYHIYVTLSSLDNSNLPIKIALTKESLGLLIYAVYLDVLNKESTIEDYLALLEKFLVNLESELECTEEGYNDFDIRFKVLETAINLLHRKKEFPVIKIVCDVLLAFFRQNKNSLKLYQIINLFSVFSHDNFVKIYDVEIFNECFYHKLYEELTLSQFELSLLNAVELLYSIDKLYEDTKPNELITLITKIIQRKEKEYALLIDMVFKFEEKQEEELKTFYNKLPHQQFKNFIEKIESEKRTVDKYRTILELKFLLKYLEKNEPTSEIIKNIKSKL